MESLYVFDSPPHPCGYLPAETSVMRYEIAGRITPADYQERLLAGWRRFGYSLFRPTCPACTRCQSIRVPVGSFVPNRSQKRAAKANADLTVHVGEPVVSRDRLALHDKFHAFQHATKAWPDRGPSDAADYADSFVRNPFRTEEWTYRLAGRLVGVGYVDALPDGLSAIYFYHDPDERDRSLGTFNVLSVLRAAADRRLPHVYLGYYVEGCRSLEYKAQYKPNEVLAAAGDWVPFR